MIDWKQVRLPAEATLIDRLTFPLWRWWHQSLRETLRLAYWTAFILAAVMVAGLLVVEAVPFGGWGVAAAALIIAGIAGGWLAGTGAKSPRPVHSAGSRLAAVALALPLALLMLTVAIFGAAMAISFIVVPAANYGLPMLVIVAFGAVFLTRLIARWRRRDAARYPPSLV